MAEKNKKTEARDLSNLLGEMATQRMYAVIMERLEELRSINNITQAEIAERMGVKEQALSRWLREPSNMRISSAGRLLGALDAYLAVSIEKFEDIRNSNAAARDKKISENNNESSRNFAIKINSQTSSEAPSSRNIGAKQIETVI